ncbi:MAG: alpha-glucoside transport system permease protein [Actinomycetota bacterium]|nr:alpha-glucoside transport system permease protein [Actinomycetota bacterium]
MDDWQSKVTMLGVGVAAFFGVVGLLLLLADRAPKTGREKFQLLFFMGPASLLLLVGLVYPSLKTLMYSFQNSDGSQWVGLRNYKWMFTQDDILIVLRNTGIWILVTPLAATAIGLLYAILIDRKRGEVVAKTLLFMPMAISFVGAGIIWKFVYEYRSPNKDQIGLLPQIMKWLGFDIKGGAMLMNAPLNTFLLIVVMVWIWAGFAMVVLSAAIKAIPTDIIEAARLDGVSSWQMFWRITLPSVRPSVIVVYMTITIGVLKVFDIVRTMTQGFHETSVVAYEMYFQAFQGNEYGHGAALAVALFVLVLPIVGFQVHQMRRQRQEAR